MSKTALITGITGQDGSYLAELLLSKGYEVHGLIRRASTFNTSRIDHLYEDPHESGVKLTLHYGDLSDGVRLVTLLNEIKPDEVYNLAAQSHVRVSFDEPEHTADTTGTGTVRLLEAIRASKVRPKFYQASTSELYGATPPPQDENTPFYPRSPYAAAKLYSYWITKNYREAYEANRLISRGLIHPTLSQTFPLQESGQATYEVHRNAHQGKVGVLCLAPEEGLGVRDGEMRERLLPEITRFAGA